MVTVRMPGVAVQDAALSHLQEVLSVHCASMPEGGILSGQSAAMCL